MTDTSAAIPSLPVANWGMFGPRTSARPPSVLDSGRYRLTTSGRAAIALGLELLGVGPGHKVLVPTYHCPTMIAPIVKLGGEPVFYPLTPMGRPDLEFILGSNIQSSTAMLVPHYFGLPQPLRELRAFCDRYGIALIEDCAHAFFGEVDDRPVGQWGDVAIASITKFFPLPEGGVLTVNAGGERLGLPTLSPRTIQENCKAVADILEVATRHQRLPALLNGALNVVFGLKRSVRALTRRSSPDFPSPASIDTATLQTAPPGMQSCDLAFARKGAVSVCSRLIHSTDTTRIADARRANYIRLAERLSGHERISPLFPLLPTGAVPYVFPLRVHAPDDVHRLLKQLGIPVFRWNLIWPGTPSFDNDTGMVWADEVLQLPCHQDLTHHDIERIVRGVLSSTGNRRPDA